jgi:flagellar hook-length control protein FliK
MARDAQIAPQSGSGVKDLKAPAFVFEVAERISAVVTGVRGEVTIQLKPDQFGRMNIVAESGASGILARITTESASLKQYLESNLPVLQQALHDQGFRVERIDVLVQEGLSQQQSPNQWQHSFGHAPGGHDSERSPRFTPSDAVQPGDAASEITLDATVMGALHPNSTFHTIA